MIKIGLIVNPVAGMGGSVGLKGTDGEIYKKAIQLGAKPVTPKRTYELLSHISNQNQNQMMFLVSPGEMGKKYLHDFTFSFQVIGRIPKQTSAADTIRIAKEMLEEEIDLLIFVGGDGTARDIYDAVGLKKPVIAVPSGVKIFSPVFAVSARAASDILNEFVNSINLDKEIEFTEKAVLDIDEQAFRENRLASKLYGYLKVPNFKKFLQKGKEASSMQTSSVMNKKEIARFIVSNMRDNILYLFGPGTTLKAITDELHVSKTLLGVDAFYKDALIGQDLNEKQILSLMKKYDHMKIIVTPIGGNGFIFGRGSKQFTPKILQQVGRDNIIIIGTADKIRQLDCLRVDTGNFEVDQMLSGHMKVIIGENEEMVLEVKC
ncbi:MAG: ATP-NAD kinase family protein [Promethearchaeota archaeon]